MTSRRSRSWSWSIACTAVVWSFTEGDSARSAMSASCRKQNATSCSIVRSVAKFTARVTARSSSSVDRRPLGPSS
ncbi:MAG TPA: hypothetical protein VKP11_12685, partial [Frankiaceae bacterium]|nr:hypothetical protein [Frankiaceae bacterium]